MSAARKATCIGRRKPPSYLEKGSLPVFNVENRNGALMDTPHVLQLTIFSGASFLMTDPRGSRSRVKRFGNKGLPSRRIAARGEKDSSQMDDWREPAD